MERITTEFSNSDSKNAGTSKRPNPVDTHVGSRLKYRRVERGLSQEKLGESLGLTFQQIQKYEKGSNRIGASRLYEIAQVLEVPVQFFFEDLPSGSDCEETNPGFADSPGEYNVINFLNTSDGFELNKAFVRIKDQKIRRKILELVKSLADSSG